MSFNTFGKIFRFTTWGESHGPAIGCIVDGCPPNIALSQKDIQKDMNRDALENQSSHLREKNLMKWKFYLVSFKEKQRVHPFL